MRSTGRSVVMMVAGAILLSGCGGGSSSGRPKPVPTSGRVTYKSSPVAGATVSFLGDGTSQPAVAITDDDGNFVLTTNRGGDGAVPGDHRVTVSKIVGGAISAEAPKALTMDEAVVAYNNKAKQGAPAKPLSMLPEKYSRQESSGLQFTVKAGEKNHFDLTLTD